MEGEGKRRISDIVVGGSFSVGRSFIVILIVEGVCYTIIEARNDEEG